MNYFSGWIIAVGFIGLFLFIAWLIAPNARIPINIPIFIKGMLPSIPFFYLPLIGLAMLLTDFWPIPYKFSPIHPNLEETKYLAAILGEESWIQIIHRLEICTRLKIFIYSWVRIALLSTLLGCVIVYLFIYHIPKISEPYDLLKLLIFLVIDFGCFGFFSMYFIYKTGLLIRIGLMLRGFSILVQNSGFVVWNLWWFFWGIFLKEYSNRICQGEVKPLLYPYRVSIGIIIMILICLAFQTIIARYSIKARIQKLHIRPLILLITSPIIVLILLYISQNLEYTLSVVLNIDIFKYFNSALHSLSYIISSPSIGHWIPSEFWFDQINKYFDTESSSIRFWFWTILISAQTITFIIIPYQVSKFIELYALQFPVSKDIVKVEIKAS